MQLSTITLKEFFYMLLLELQGNPSVTEFPVYANVYRPRAISIPKLNAFLYFDQSACL